MSNGVTNDLGHWRYVEGTARASRYPSRVDRSIGSDTYTSRLANVLPDTEYGPRSHAIKSSNLFQAVSFKLLALWEI